MNHDNAERFLKAIEDIATDSGKAARRMVKAVDNLDVKDFAGLSGGTRSEMLGDIDDIKEGIKEIERQIDRTMKELFHFTKEETK